MSLFLEQKIPSSVSEVFIKPNMFLLTTSLVSTIIDINSELDELDREEFYRLKKVQDKKQRDAEASELERKLKKEAELAAAVDKAMKDGASPEEANKIVQEKEASKEAEAEASVNVNENENENDDDVVF